MIDRRRLGWLGDSGSVIATYLVASVAILGVPDELSHGGESLEEDSMRLGCNSGCAKVGDAKLD